MTYPGTILKAFQLFAKKELGQNFLADPNMAKHIVAVARISSDDVVLEIGPGLGALTVHLAEKAKKIYAVEKDHRLIQHLKNELAAADVSNVEVLNQDIFRFNIDTVASPENKLVVLGNLPYNISSQVLFKLVENRSYVSRAVLMFQKELAERICAPPGSRTYGRLSAVMQYCSTVKILTGVSSSLFFPKPDVESTVIEVDFFDRQEISYDKEVFLFKVIKAAFSKRRKTLKNSLTGEELAISRENVEKGLNEANIDPSRRAETLTVDEFKMLCEALYPLRAAFKDNS
ncbi:Ribosomal RNA small subunit methyltransferase A [Desulfamplus magnetovallimortis]|uniref:Ribosomal RNA small subunit methyltransferase A n=1 Tax=Desulfamplus magnetovallimortis TaxID=1246637 RepID=A0A1W1HGH7_9BACT|nr:16S rRNA (adenine(1518)-N(6)/adenine(1519)-N(6))-dimethyltransferase RsmA [Desulfamplus magnetovallimortis]SLM31546.1 Ribosomal RNA small subunit methyltransferase A [Desulfamplus magnetovallimortis]